MKTLVQTARFPTGLALRKRKDHNLMQGQMNDALALLQQTRNLLMTCFPILT